MPQKKSRAPVALKLSITPSCSSMELGDIISEETRHSLYTIDKKMLDLDENIIITGVDLA